MGNQPPSNAPPKPLSMEEQIINMKLTAKRFERQGNAAEKEKQKNIAKAKQCLLKGDEEGAKLFVQNSTQKENERVQCIRMSHQLQALSGSIKSNQNNMQMTQELARVTPFLVSQANEVPLEEVQKTIDKFMGAMDNMVVGGKIMENAMGKLSSDKNTTNSVKDEEFSS